MSEPSQAHIDYAGEILSRNGVRLMRIEGQPTIGIWSHLDSPEIRFALGVFDNGHLPVRYLDDPATPMRYRSTRLVGDPVPLSVVRAMYRAARPWEERDRRLQALKWREPPVRLL